MTLQQQSVSGPEVTTAIGFFLTLVGLLGTFFYVHLSNWLREILELKAKYDLNSKGDSEDRRKAVLECRFQLKRLRNHIPVLVALLISTFLGVVTYSAAQLIRSLDPRPLLMTYYLRIGTVFLLIYAALTLYFLIHGYLVANRIKEGLNPKQS